MFASLVGFPSNGKIDSPILEALSTYQNIHYRNTDWYNYATDTPAEKWVRSDRMLTTKHYMGHLSDFIRLLSIYKFGGIHLDLDVVVQTTLENLPPNFIGAQHYNEVQNSMFGFESRDVGHKIVELILRFVKCN